MLGFADYKAGGAMKYSNTLPKFQTKALSNEQLYFMELSLKECEDKVFKEVHCPHCGLLIGYCPIDEDTYIVKSARRKCI